MGGGLGPVWVVVLHAVQHRVSGGGFSVDHLSWERRGISIYLNPVNYYHYTTTFTTTELGSSHSIEIHQQSQVTLC